MIMCDTVGIKIIGTDTLVITGCDTLRKAAAVAIVRTELNGEPFPGVYIHIYKGNRLIYGGRTDIHAYLYLWKLPRGDLLFTGVMGPYYGEAIVKYEGDNIFVLIEMGPHP